MKIFRRICYLVTILGLLISSTIQVTAREAKYRYQITVESEDWFDYTVQEKTEMLRIADDELNKMNDKQLVTAIADYPYLIDIYAYDSIDMGIEKLAENCDAFKELMNRKTGKSSMIKYGKQIVNKANVTSSNEGRDAFITIALNDIVEHLETRVITM